MTNKERYKQAFSTLHASAQLLEVEEMAQFKKKRMATGIAAAIAACTIIVGGSGTAYAADIGGIQEKLSMWFHATKTEVEVTDNEDGGYTIHYETDEGTKEVQWAGGVTIETNGSMSWLSAEELIDVANQHAMVETDENGDVRVYYYDQALNITELFDDSGICRIILLHDATPVYLKVTQKPDGTYPFSQSDEPEDDRESYVYIIADGQDTTAP